jgi:hypothetical protein
LRHGLHGFRDGIEGVALGGGDVLAAELC